MRRLPRLAAPALVGFAALVPAAPLAQPLETGPRWVSTATEAYLVSAASTLGPIALGAGLYHVLPASSPDSDAFAPRHAALVLLVTGAVIGPSMGNVSLGAVGDARRALLIKGAGVAAGAGLALGATMVAVLSCFGGPECGSGAEALAIAGAVVAGAGIVEGTAYDLATIPGNAARGRPGRSVRVRPAGAGLALTVAL